MRDEERGAIGLDVLLKFWGSLATIQFEQLQAMYTWRRMLSTKCEGVAHWSPEFLESTNATYKRHCCPMCRVETTPDTVHHVMFECTFVQRLWRDTRPRDYSHQYTNWVALYQDYRDLKKDEQRTRWHEEMANFYYGIGVYWKECRWARITSPWQDYVHFKNRMKQWLVQKGTRFPETAPRYHIF